ncbi:hypothetical protein [Bowmanella yangjiangensis]|uniref:Nuclear transport factor 2 family protein n=1 Tax=Bowmanella yangjiangensis TaxID=2811230 RepID=A0ABS3CMZ7_9ALTE|nr:hypothetical protein [Bowmanella yangjiangensis]MBN7818497.1 hypothetical protein [Bowmanella yangjiangensis]
MRYFLLLLTLCLGHAAQAEPASQSALSPEQQQVLDLTHKVLNAQRIAYSNLSSLAAIDALFALYTDDYIYQHEGYGGRYSRELLYNNSVSFFKQGRYQDDDPDSYQLVSLLPGKQAAAVQRLYQGKNGQELRLTLFEFKGDKVSRIVEYW